MVGHWQPETASVVFPRNLASRECTAGLTDDEEENIFDGKIYGNYCGAGCVRPAAQHLAEMASV